MAELKTQPNDASVDEFLESLEDQDRREDCRKLVGIMKRITRADPQMWGKSMVGFGRYRYRYASGREGEWFLSGFSPRKQDLTIYVMAGLSRYGELLKKLGRHRTGKSCLYLKRLDDADPKVLRELITASVRHVKPAPR